MLKMAARLFLLSDDLRKKNGVQISFGRTMKLLIGRSNKNQQKLKGGRGRGGGLKKGQNIVTFWCPSWGHKDMEERSTCRLCR